MLFPGFSILPNSETLASGEHRLYNQGTRLIYNMSFAEDEYFTSTVTDQSIDLSLNTSGKLIGAAKSGIPLYYLNELSNLKQPENGLVIITSNSSADTDIVVGLSSDVINDEPVTISLTSATVSGLWMYNNGLLRGPSFESSDSSVIINSVNFDAYAINTDMSGVGWSISGETMYLYDNIVLNSSSNFMKSDGTARTIGLIGGNGSFTLNSNLLLTSPSITTSNDILYADGAFSNANPYYKYSINSSSISTSLTTFNLSFNKINVFDNIITTSDYETININMATTNLDLDETISNYHQRIYIKLTKSNSDYNPKVINLQLNENLISTFDVEGILSISFILDLFRTSLDPMTYTYTIT